MSIGNWRSGLFEPAGMIHCYSMESIGVDMIEAGATALYNSASALNPTADLAYYIPFFLCKRVKVPILWCLNGAAVQGNIDIKLYNVDGVALTPSVQRAQAGINTYQTINIAAVWIGPGLHYMAVVLSDAAVGTFFRTTMFANGAPAITGMQQQQLGAGAALPDVATFATITGNYIPIFGLLTGNRTVV